MPFKKDVTLKSKFEVDKLFDKLEAAMEFDIKHPDKRKFRGRVDRTTNTFTITQPMVGNERDSLRPEIKGFIRNDEGLNTRFVELNFGINSGNKTLLIMGLILYTILFCVSLFIVIYQPENSVYYKWAVRGSIIIPIFTLFSFLLALYFFTIKSSEAIDDLCFIFGAREV